MISRRSFLAGLPAVPSLARAQSRRPPNILFFLTDDQRWDAAGFMGNTILRTPHMDRLARAGTVFTNNFVTTSICMTSRASILTGLYARAHGCNDFKNPLTDGLYRGSFPGVLRAAGYRTGYCGKWGVGPENQEQRYDYFRAFRGQGDLMVTSGGKTVGSPVVLAEQAAEFLRGCPASQPFCMQVAFNSPHAQDNAPWQYLYEKRFEEMYRDARVAVPDTAAPAYWSRFPQGVQRSEMRRRWAIRFATPEVYQETVRRYYRLIASIDEAMGSILGELASRGLDDNTVVVFTSDNGYYLGEYAFADKWLMHEPSIRTPMVVYDPRAAGAARGRRLDAMTLNIDIAPTLIDLAGAAAPPSMQGRSLGPLLRGESTAWRRDWFYEHLYRYNGWIPATEGVRTSRWKYTRYIDEDPLFEELFDLDRDPLEKSNLAGSREHAGMLARLRARRETWLGRLGEWRQGERWSEPAPEGALV
jgi:arylsulfatase A-like enzyme